MRKQQLEAANPPQFNPPSYSQFNAALLNCECTPRHCTALHGTARHDTASWQGVHTSRESTVYTVYEYTHSLDEHPHTSNCSNKLYRYTDTSSSTNENVRHLLLLSFTILTRQYYLHAPRPTSNLPVHVHSYVLPYCRLAQQNLSVIEQC